MYHSFCSLTVMYDYDLQLLCCDQFDMQLILPGSESLLIIVCYYCCVIDFSLLIEIDYYIL